jgi:hypothetical protein
MNDKERDELVIRVINNNSGEEMYGRITSPEQ